MLGRGQLDSSDASAVSLGKTDGVMAGPGTDVQDAAAGDVTKDFSSRSDPSQGAQDIWSGMGGA